MTEDLTEKIREALINAKENGYSFDELAPAEIAADLISYDADLEHEDILEVCDAIQAIRCGY